MKKLKFEEITLNQLLIVLGLIILVIPPILVYPAFWKQLDFSNTGQIGDTIGGITSPFISAIAAVLVYVAFKEQIKANNLLKEQQYFQHIQEQIHRLEEDFFKLEELTNSIRADISISEQIPNNISYETGYPLEVFLSSQTLNKVLYTTALFLQTYELIEKLENKEFMLKKLKTLYKIIYQTKYKDLRKVLNTAKRSALNVEGLVSETLFQISDLEQKLKD